MKIIKITEKNLLLRQYKTTSRRRNKSHETVCDIDFLFYFIISNYPCLIEMNRFFNSVLGMLNHYLKRIILNSFSLKLVIISIVFASLSTQSIFYGVPNRTRYQALLFFKPFLSGFRCMARNMVPLKDPFNTH